MLTIYKKLILFNKVLSNIDSFIAKKSFKENNSDRLMKEKK
jgi:hypothetical protein